MADYTQPEFVDKRVRYFNGQFLQEQDFIDSDRYQIDRERRHSRLFHSPGVASGLVVRGVTGQPRVQVDPGTAVDPLGRQLVLSVVTPVDVTVDPGRTVLVTIGFLETPSDAQGGTGGSTRWHERPQLAVVAEGQVQPNALVLARLTFAANGTIQIDNNLRVNAGLRLAGGPILNADATGQAILDGALGVRGATTMQNTLTVSGATTLQGNVGLGVTPALKRLHVESGELRVRASHNNTTADIGAFLAQNLTQGIGIGFNRIEAIGSDANQNIELRPKGSGQVIIPDAALSFGSSSRQAINLYSTTHGIGVQNSTQYFRSDKNFAWYVGGTHNAGELQAGGGTASMTLNNGLLDVPRVFSTSQGLLSVRPVDTVNEGGEIQLLGAGSNQAVAVDNLSGHLRVMAGGAERLRVASSGNVAIGATAADGRLTIAEATGTAAGPAAGTLIIDHENAGGASSIVFRSRVNRGGDYGYIQYQDAATVGGAGETARLIIGTSNEPDDHIALMPSGSVGIGTMNLTSKLHIAGNGGLLSLEGTDHAYIQWYPRGLAATRQAWMGFGGAGTAVLSINNDSVGNAIHLGGNVNVSGTLQTGGDIAIAGKHAFRGSDAWLRLNQDGTFTGGVHTPGLFAPGSLNVGGANNYASPGVGNMVTSGNCFVKVGTSFRNGGWSGLRTWDLEVDGTAWCWHGYLTGPRDLAENYYSDQDLEPGDVVCLHPERDAVVRSERAHDLAAIGVISTAPGFLLNSQPDAGQHMFPVALCGRVPCKVTSQNGPIRRGDLLTTSSTPGYAMKARPVVIGGEAIFRPGTIIGKALEAFDSDLGTIEIFVASH